MRGYIKGLELAQREVKSRNSYERGIIKRKTGTRTPRGHKAGTPAGEAIIYETLILARLEVIIIGWILLREKPYHNDKVTPMARLCHIKCKEKHRLVLARREAINEIRQMPHIAY